jgi:hypothetical protein
MSDEERAIAAGQDRTHGPHPPLLEGSRLLGILVRKQTVRCACNCFKNLRQPNHKNFCFREHRA